MIRQHGRAFAATAGPPRTDRSAAEHVPDAPPSIADVKNIQAAAAFARKSQLAPDDLANDLRILKGLGFSYSNRKASRLQANKRGVYPSQKFRVAQQLHGSGHGDFGKWLLYECRRRAIAELPGVAEHVDAELHSTRCTPSNVKEFADALRDPEARKYMPFGKNFESSSTRMAGETQARNSKKRLLECGVVARWLALFELQEGGFEYAAESRNPLPFLYSDLLRCLMDCRELRRGQPDRLKIDTASALATHLHEKQPRHPQWLHSMLHFAVSCEDRSDAVEQAAGAKTIKLHQDVANAVASKFFDFRRNHALETALEDIDPFQMVSLALFHAQLSLREAEPVHVSRSWEHAQPKRQYVPAAEVRSPEPPYFIKLAEGNAAGATEPIISAPRHCYLCGGGFLTREALRRHCDAEHGGLSQYRTRLFWEAKTRRYAQPLRPIEKRRLIGNFHRCITRCTPAQGLFAMPEVERAIVACAVCARQRWIDSAFPCAMWRPHPKQASGEESDDGEEEDDDSDNDDSNREKVEQVLHRNVLRDEHRFYFGPARKVDEVLRVSAYCQRWPQIPTQDLHASSVQHPLFPSMRWLLHTRRVPMRGRCPAEEAASPGVEAAATGDGAAEHMADGEPSQTTRAALPACAGVGDAGQDAWLCRECVLALCVRKPKVPPLALANDLFGGRMHPLYRDLSPAMRATLSPGRAIVRLFLLRARGEDEDTAQKGFSGNVVFLAQPSSKQILEALPPDGPEMQKCFSVAFNTSRADVAKQPGFVIERERYVRCAELRKRVCPCFAEIAVDREKAKVELAVDGVPPAVQRGAVEMASLEKFQPNLLGPASKRDPCAKEPDTDDEADRDLEDEATAAAPSGAVSEEGDSKAAPAASRDREPCLRGLLPDEGFSSEVLIGMPAETNDHPVERMAVFAEKLRLAEDYAKSLQRTEERLREYGQSDAERVGLAACAASRRSEHKDVCVQLGQMAKDMGDARFREQLEDSINSVQKSRDSTKLVLHPGDLLNLFDPRSWAASFVQFFYGDCTPNLARPRKIGMGTLFCALQEREELEYYLPADADDPDIPGERYAAPAACRWDTPEFAAVFAASLRTMVLLQSTRGFYRNQRLRNVWHRDVAEIAKIKASDIERFQRDISTHSSGNLSALMAQARDKGHTKVFKLLKHLLMVTAVVPLTDGHKQSLRQAGHAMNLHRGPMSLFFTTNFADTWSPILAKLNDGPGPAPRFPCWNEVTNGANAVLQSTPYDQARCLLDDAPAMPAHREMHRISSQRPMLQTWHYLLYDAAMHTEVLCIRNAFVGKYRYDFAADLASLPEPEDDLASTGESGINNFVTEAQRPNESQGRGYTHGHEKETSLIEPMGVDRLCELLGPSLSDREADKRIDEWCCRAREQGLEACATLQYDSAALPAEQLGVDVGPEPFSVAQQKESKYDGEPEIDGSRRELIETTEPKAQWHIERDRRLAEIHGRPPQHPFKSLSIRGAEQSVLPNYRDPASFGRHAPITRDGLPDRCFDGGAAEHAGDDASAARAGCLAPNARGAEDAAPSPFAPYILRDDDRVVGFRWPDGTEATEEQIAAEAGTWAKSFGHHTFGLQKVNHMHGCTTSCYKNVKKTKKAAKTNKVQRCRFDFDRIVALVDSTTGKARRFLRKGKNLVAEAVVQNTNERNEYGRILPVRRRPYTSSTNDVAQACGQSNIDYQFQPRFPPDKALATAQANHSDIDFIFGRKKLTDKQRRLLRLFGVAMRSSHIADFYATKYFAKPQQTLSSGLGAIFFGLQQLEARRALAEDPQQDDVTVAAMQVMRSAAFAIQKCYWNSACECAMFIKTNSTALFTKPEVVLFASRSFAMLHECKRLLNKKTPCRGILFVQDPDHAPLHLDGAVRIGAANQHAGGVEVAAASGGEAAGAERPRNPGLDGAVGSNAGVAEHRFSDGDGSADEARPASPMSGDDADMDAAEDQLSDGDGPADEARPAAAISCDDADPSVRDQAQGHAADASAAPVAEHAGAVNSKVLTFQPSEVKNIIDDWLHRGEELHDMDLYSYAGYIERVRRPSASHVAFRRRFGRVFLFVEHYDLSGHYMQVRRKRPHRVRIVGPNCPRISVNEGEDNALYKSLLFSLARCDGESECSSPLVFSALYFPRRDLPLEQTGCAHKFSASPRCRRCASAEVESACAQQWRARSTRIFKVLAPRAVAKLAAAKRIATLPDTSLFKGWDGEGREPSDAASEGRLLPCLVFAIVAERRRAAHSEGRHFDSCESVTEGILRYLALPVGRHEDQLTLAEFCAYEARRVLVNLDMIVESRNFAQRDAAAKGADLEADSEKPSEKNVVIQYDNPLGDPVEEADAPELEKEEPLRGLLCEQVRSLDEAVALLTRREDIEGNGQRHRQRQMRQVHAAFAASFEAYAEQFPLLREERRRPEVDVSDLFNYQDATAKALLTEHVQHEEAAYDQAIGAAEHADYAAREAFIETVQAVDEDLVARGPLAVAFHLSGKAELNEDQMRPVVILADAMQKPWEKERDRRITARAAGQLEAEPAWLIPPCGKLGDLLIVGGGGCGKTRIVTKVLDVLFRMFFGPRGCVRTAYSNKASRLIGGRTSHKISKITPKRANFLGLRVANDAEQKALECLWVPAGALIKDEFSQNPAAMENAICLRAAYARAPTYNLDVEARATPGHTFGDMPIVVTCGDELQLPPVPETSSLLTPIEGRSKEHRCGVQIFQQQTWVIRLQTMFRFNGNDSQKKILELMRQPGGCRLTTSQWRELLSTDIAHGASLRGTEAYTHCSYAWSSVCMGQAERSKTSAKMAGKTLYVIPAQDRICDRSAQEIRSLGLAKLVLQHPNMNDMNHLPGLALLHNGMAVRCTMTLHQTEIPPDTTGTIQWIDLHPDDQAGAGAAEHAAPLRLLTQFPRAVAIKIDGCDKQFLPSEPCPKHASTQACDQCTECKFFKGVFLVKPMDAAEGSQPHAWRIEVQDVNGATHQVKGFRRQLPLTTVRACTLFTLQGSTAHEGLIFHWVFPNRISVEARWLATYVALSRPPALALLRSIGMTGKLRTLIEKGPPEGLVQRFGELFDEKLELSDKFAADLLRRHGWI